METKLNFNKVLLNKLYDIGFHKLLIEPSLRDEVRTVCESQN